MAQLMMASANTTDTNLKETITLHFYRHSLLLSTNPMKKKLLIKGFIEQLTSFLFSQLFNGLMYTFAIVLL